MKRMLKLAPIMLSLFLTFSQSTFAMRVYVKTLNGKNIVIEDIEGENTIADLKEMISDKDGTPVDTQRLIWNGKQLDDKQTIDECEIIKDSTLHLVTRLKGGN